MLTTTLFIFSLILVIYSLTNDTNYDIPLINENFINIYKYHYELAEESNALDKRMISHFNECENGYNDEIFQYYRDVSYLSPGQIQIYSEIGSLSTYIPQKLTESFFDIPLDNLNEFLQTTEDSNYPTLKDFFEGFKKYTLYDDEFHKVIINHVELGNSDLLEWTKRVVERIKGIPGHAYKWKFILITPTIDDIIPKYYKIQKTNNITIRKKTIYNNIVPTLYDTLYYIKSKLPTKTFVVVLRNENMSIWKAYRDSYKYCQFSTKDWFEEDEKIRSCINCNDSSFNQKTWEMLQKNITRYFNNKFFNINIINLLDNFVPLTIKTNKTKGEWIDLSLLSIDCKHLSDIGISTLHTAIWNWITSPTSSKYESRSYFKPIVHMLKCPLPSCPFMSTENNYNFCEYNGIQYPPKIRSYLLNESFGEEIMIFLLVSSALSLYLMIWKFVGKLIRKEEEYIESLRNKGLQLPIIDEKDLLNI
uniref:Plasmodium vivax Vir protein n=1 Tax=Strongyloides venezuelensis TaxID=75913 RepID=A0A0K0EZG8_STRVS